MKRILFIWSQNRLRSPTAERVFSACPGLECSSAGLNNDAENPVTPELLEWAEVISVLVSRAISRSTVSANVVGGLGIQVQGEKNYRCLSFPG
jgi:predicted protein tyrosine phosphatase